MSYKPLLTRLRRLRATPAIREMLAQPMVRPEQFVYPIFVSEGKNVKQAIDAMPGQHRWSVDRLPEVVEHLMDQGVNAVILFGVPDSADKATDAAASYHPEGLVQRATKLLRTRFPELQIFTDVCICAYTEDGQCELPHQSTAKRNDQTLDVLAKMAVSHAQAGCDCVAPSAMMDGQVAALRQALDDNDCADTMLMSYSTKFASAMYGPFRSAAASAPGHGDRTGYQADYRDARSALRESYQDVAEGADMLMVKPSLFYLDLIHQLRTTTELPIAAYNVSGEYSMLYASSQAGYGDLRMMVRESIHALARSGTDIFVSYWANQYRELLQD